MVTVLVLLVALTITYVTWAKSKTTGNTDDILYYISVEKKYGYINKAGEMVIAPQFDGIDTYYFTGELAIVKRDGKYGYINKSGKIVIEPQDEIDFRGDLASVRIDGKYGYINKTFNIVIKPQFEDAVSFTDDLGAVKMDGKWGYISKTGNIVIEPQFEDAWPFTGELAIVKRGGKYGFINRAGKIVVEPQFEYVSSFEGDLAAIEKDGKYGYINKAGKVVIELKFQVRFAFPFKGDLAMVGLPDDEYILDGYINKAGKLVVRRAVECGRGVVKNGAGITTWPRNIAQICEEQGRASERRQASSRRSGAFRMFAGMPENKGYYWYYGASCEEGGSAFVNIQKDSPNVYCYSATGGSPGRSSCEVGIGVEAGLRKACGGD